MEDPKKGSPLKSTVEIVNAFIGIGMAAIAVVVFLTGGFTPHTQVALANLTQQTEQLRFEVAAMRGAVNALPTPQAFNDVFVHIEALRERINKDEIASEGVRVRVESLATATQAPVRSPR